MLSTVLSIITPNSVGQRGGSKNLESKKGRPESPQRKVVAVPMDSKPGLTDQQQRYLAFLNMKEARNTGRFVPSYRIFDPEMEISFKETRGLFFEKKVLDYSEALSQDISDIQREDCINDFITSMLPSVDHEIEKVFGCDPEMATARVALRVGVLSKLREDAGVQTYRQAVRAHPCLVQLDSK